MNFEEILNKLKSGLEDLNYTSSKSIQIHKHFDGNSPAYPLVDLRLGTLSDSALNGDDQLQTTLTVFADIAYSASQSSAALTIVQSAAQLARDLLHIPLEDSTTRTQSVRSIQVTTRDDLSGSLVWRVELDVLSLIGASGWEALPELSPTSLFLSQAPDIGAVNEAKYEDLLA